MIFTFSCRFSCRYNSKESKLTNQKTGYPLITETNFLHDLEHCGYVSNRNHTPGLVLTTLTKLSQAVLPQKIYFISTLTFSLSVFRYFVAHIHPNVFELSQKQMFSMFESPLIILTLS